MRKAVFILAVLPCMAYTQTAGAQTGRHASKMTIKQVAQSQLRIIAKDRWVIRTRKVHDSYVVWWHRQQLKWTLREYRETRAKMAPPIAHKQGWLCIHSNEASWSDDGAPYYGGLQMSKGWMGVVTYANLLSPTAQMALAERVAAQHGFSYSFMKQQWPNTYPPCAGYF
jgi:hypothetical protein